MDFLPNFPNTVVLFDRGYPSEELFRFLDAKNIFFLMRIPQTYKKAVLEKEDALFTYPASPMEKGLTLRSLLFLLENGSTEYLVNNIIEDKMAYSTFKELYRLRWGIENKYSELKSRLKIEAFNSLKPVAAGVLRSDVFIQPCSNTQERCGFGYPRFW